MPIGYFSDLANAKLYFKDERLETSFWDNLDDTKREKLINQAYNRIYHSPRFAVPTYAAATAAQRVKLRIANAEMAYYMAVHLADEDRRKGLQSQGVTDAGIVEEKYNKDSLDKLPIPPSVLELLDEFDTEEVMAMIPVDRDESEDLDTDVVEE